MNPHSNEEGYPFWNELGRGKCYRPMEQFAQLASSAGHSSVVLDPKGDSVRIEAISNEATGTYIYGLPDESASAETSQDDARDRKDELEDREEGSGDERG